MSEIKNYYYYYYYMPNNDGVKTLPCLALFWYVKMCFVSAYKRYKDIILMQQSMETSLANTIM